MAIQCQRSNRVVNAAQDPSLQMHPLNVPHADRFALFGGNLDANPRLVRDLHSKHGPFPRIKHIWILYHKINCRCFCCRVFLAPMRSSPRFDNLSPGHHQQVWHTSQEIRQSILQCLKLYIRLASIFGRPVRTIQPRNMTPRNSL